MIKVALATLLLSAVALSAPIATDSEEYVTSKFQDFIHKHGKVYSAYEYPKRLAAFTSNLRKIEYMNTANLARKEGAVHGVNQFADLTEEEFKKTYLSGFIPDMVKNAPMLDEVVEKVNNLKVDAIPTEWDWTTQGAVTHVKNQGQCGSCWSFSATGNMEGQNFLVNKKLVSLSEEQLVDCDTVDQGCNGGLPSNAYQYVMKTGGLDTEASYPYTAGGGSGGSCAYNPANSAITVKSWSALPTDETKLAAWLYTYGPISIGINAGWMQTYSHGVANPLICPASGIDHGVLIVGYGTEKGVFGTTPFWKIKNSWGESWGEQGYCRIVRGKAKCGLNTMCTSAVVNAATEAQQKIQARDAILA